MQVCTPCTQERVPGTSLLVNQVELPACARIVQEVAKATTVLNY
jgi:hypothetical protein